MTIILTLLVDGTPFLQWPGFAGFLGWIASLAALISLLWFWRRYQPAWEVREAAIFFPLAIAEIFLTLFIGVRFPLEAGIPIPGLLASLDSVAWMAFAAVPWVLGAGLLGPLSSFLLALLSGLLFAVFEMHNPFTALEYALFGLLMGVAVNQRYRTLFFAILRRPLAAAILLALFHPFAYLIGIIFWASAPLPAQLAYAFSSVLPHSLAYLAIMIVAGGVGELTLITLPTRWGSSAPLVPSPAEKSIETRTFYLMGIVVGMVALTLAALGWNVAYGAAETLIQERMTSTSRLAAENVPYALEVGQNLMINAAADERLNEFDQGTLRQTLNEKISANPYFNQFLLAESTQGIIATSGDGTNPRGSLTPEETAGVALALEGVPFQYYSSHPQGTESTAQVSFIAPVPGRERVLIGRSDLGQNPFTANLVTSLNNLQDIGGEGLLIDEAGVILYHRDAALISTEFASTVEAAGTFVEIIGSDGVRRLEFAQTSLGRPWTIVVTVPVQEIQQLALSIAAPLVGLLLALSLALMLLLRVTLRVVTGSLRNLSDEAARIAEDRKQLAMPLLIEGVDEVGRMRLAFDKMRASLKARLDEQEQLLLVSHGAASSLEFDLAVKPILGAALSMGAISARVALAPGAIPDTAGDALTVYGAGAAGDRFGYLDEQILGINRTTSPVVMSNPAGDRRLAFQGNSHIPIGIVAVALRHKNLYYGSLWVAYDRPHSLLEDEQRFLVTLAGQAALAAANARLFMSAEIGRQRLAAILASSPDPVLVTDRQNRLLLSNPAAWQILGQALEQGSGKPIQDLLSQPELVDILKSAQEEEQTREITLEDDRIYIAKASTVLADGRQAGRICVLRDVTRFMELDKLKSEFVSTVSHDLRSPLTLMRGYATMTQMVGNLNEEQETYVQKMVAGVESMTRLVNNLLDLGRIEAGVDLNLEFVSLIDIILHVVDAIQLAASAKNIDLKFEFPPDSLPVLEADAGLIEQAVHNLIENAIKYTLDGGTIMVELKVIEAQETAVIEVRDSGIGITPSDQLRLFEKFYRVAHRETRRQRGSGLGLAIVKTIVERHGGRVWVRSELGVGSTFSMVLPLKQPGAPPV